MLQKHAEPRYFHIPSKVFQLIKNVSNLTPLTMTNITPEPYSKSTNEKLQSQNDAHSASHLLRPSANNNRRLSIHTLTMTTSFPSALNARVLNAKRTYIHATLDSRYASNYLPREPLFAATRMRRKNRGEKSRRLIFSRHVRVWSTGSVSSLAGTLRADYIYLECVWLLTRGLNTISFYF